MNLFYVNFSNAWQAHKSPVSSFFHSPPQYSSVITYSVFLKYSQLGVPQKLKVSCCALCDMMGVPVNV